jgi:hypothetical protein
MKLFIPPLGTELELSEPWMFKLYDEYRNSNMMELMNLNSQPYRYGEPIKTFDMVIPIGTVLKVDRIYIRKGASEFDSVTLRTKIGKKSIRFWVKLADFNTMVVKDIV